MPNIWGAERKGDGFWGRSGQLELAHLQTWPAPHPHASCPSVQKCADLNQMSTKNLSLLFAPSLFQTDGKGEHEVKVMEDLIDNYVTIFNVSFNVFVPPQMLAPCSSLFITHSGPAPTHSPLRVDAMNLLSFPGRLMRTRCPRWSWRTV